MLKIYSQSVDIEDIKKDYEAIKSELIKIVSFVHPDLPQDIEKEYEKAKQFFINLFGNQKKYSLYTINYDFILYWIIMKMKEEKLNMLSDDGFRQGRKEDKFVIWENDFDHQRNIWYLHGALHLFREDFYLKKNT